MYFFKLTTPIKKLFILIIYHFNIAMYTQDYNDYIIFFLIELLKNDISINIQ